MRDRGSFVAMLLRTADFACTFPAEKMREIGRLPPGRAVFARRPAGEKHEWYCGVEIKNSDL